MSFKNLNKEDLLYAAEFVNLNVSDKNTKAEIIAALEEANFSWNNYKKFVAADGGEVPVDDLEETSDSKFDQTSNITFNQMVLLKMERQNPTFDILGRRFTKSQPFQVLTADEAQEIIDAAEAEGGGFRIATPAEAKSYFG